MASGVSFTCHLPPATRYCLSPTRMMVVGGYGRGRKRPFSSSLSYNATLPA
ncbi:MAG: hypothetical protein M5U34_30655 [Chloroflexi bacterium]|nr:hypothetical protein [Chloroflexota bacterium]